MFYNYRQNNSGGSFDIDDVFTSNMIIEADNATESDSIAESIGIYFNGCEDDRDCPCCGDRWDSQWGDGDTVPSIYGEPVGSGDNTYNTMWVDKGQTYARIFYKNGVVEDVKA